VRGSTRHDYIMASSEFEDEIDSSLFFDMRWTQREGDSMRIALSVSAAANDASLWPDMMFVVEAKFVEPASAGPKSSASKVVVVEAGVDLGGDRDVTEVGCTLELPEVADLIDTAKERGSSGGGGCRVVCSRQWRCRSRSGGRGRRLSSRPEENRRARCR